MSQDKDKFTIQEVCKQIDEKTDRIKEMGDYYIGQSCSRTWQQWILIVSPFSAYANIKTELLRCKAKNQLQNVVGLIKKTSKNIMKKQQQFKDKRKKARVYRQEIPAEIEVMAEDLVPLLISVTMLFVNYRNMMRESQSGQQRQTRLQQFVIQMKKIEEKLQQQDQKLSASADPESVRAGVVSFVESLGTVVDTLRNLLQRN